MREDYSADGDAWAFFPFEHSHARAYRWGEDGIAGLCDRYGFLNLAVAAWNGQDDRLKERLFGLTNGEGNHGEDAKETSELLDADSRLPPPEGRSSGPPHDNRLTTTR